jgi:hypothetical protein
MFDAVTYSAVQKLSKTEVGTAVLVPDSFASTDFLDAGTTFLSDDYPLLGSVIAPSFNGNNWTEVPIVSTYETNSPNLNGNYSLSCTFVGPISGDTYFVWGSGIVVCSRTSAPDVLEYVTRIATPSVYGKATFTSNNRLYWSTSVGTYYIDLSANENFTTIIPVTMPVVGSWRVRYNAISGTYLAINSAAAGNTISSSSDGVTFTANIVTTFLASARPQDILYANGYWMIVTSGTSAATCACWSTTGLTGSWTNITLSTTGYSNIAYSPTLDMWCVSTLINTTANAFYTCASTPNTAWTARSSIVAVGAGNAGYLIVTSDGGFAFGSNNSSSPIVKSTNGTAWTTISTNNGGYPMGSAINGNPLTCGNGLAAIGSSVIAFGQLTSGYGAIIYYAISDDFFVTLRAMECLTTGTPGRTSAMNSITWLANDQIGFASDVAISATTSGGGTYLGAGLAHNGLKTTDGGLTWTSASFPTCIYISGKYLGFATYFFTATLTKFVVVGTLGNGSTTLFTGTSSDLVTWTWNSVPTLVATSVGAVGAAGEQIALISTSTIVYLSNDYGATYTSSNLTMQDRFISRPQIKSRYASNITGYGYVTVLGSATPPGGPTTAASYFAANGSNGLMVTITTASSTVYVSADFGQSYTARVSPVFPSSVAVYRNWIILVTATGLTCRSNDYGVTWIIGSFIGNAVLNSTGRFALLNNINNTKIYAIGTAMVERGNTLYISDATKRTIPPMSPPSSGFKWAVKAR